MNRCCRWFIAFLCGPVLACAQAVQEIPLRPAAAVPEAPPEEVTYRPTALDDRGFNRTVRQISVPTLTVYLPTAARADRAALVVCPGGGYSSVVIDREGHAFARHFQSRGFVVAVLKYRLPQPELAGDGLPLSQQDALEALRVVRRRAAEWNVNPRRVGILGSSAGGHLAASVAIIGDGDAASRPDFVGLLYPVITLEPPHAHAGSRTRLLGDGASAEAVAAWSLHRRVQPGLPPFFVVHAKDDKAVPIENAELLVGALQQAQVPHRLLIFETGGHGFSLGRARGAESARWPAEFEAWIDRLEAK